MDDAPLCFQFFSKKTSPILLRSESKADPGHPQRHFSKVRQRFRSGLFDKNGMIPPEGDDFTAGFCGFSQKLVGDFAAKLELHSKHGGR